MGILTTVIAVLLLMQSTACAEEPWRFLTLADWHLAEMYVQPDRYPERIAIVADGLKMLKANYGGELIMLPGDSNRGHWDTKKFIKSFKPGLTPAEAILQAGTQTCFYNCVAPEFIVEAPPGGICWVIGSAKSGDESARVIPVSLYYQQVQDRLGKSALDRLATAEQRKHLGKYFWVKDRLKNEMK